MTDIRQNQFAIVSPLSSETNSIRANLLGVVAVTGETPPPAPMQTFQIAITGVNTEKADLHMRGMAIVYVMSPGAVVISPDRAIGLECWQPCLSYGTNALVYWKR